MCVCVGVCLGNQWTLSQLSLSINVVKGFLFVVVILGGLFVFFSFLFIHSFPHPPPLSNIIFSLVASFCLLNI